MYYAQILMQGKGGAYTSVFRKYQQKAEYFMCSCLGKGSRNVQKTPGGLIFRQRWNNMQFVTSASFLLTVYSDYLTSAGNNMQCSGMTVPPSELFSTAKTQVRERSPNLAINSQMTLVGKHTVSLPLPCYLTISMDMS